MPRVEVQLLVPLPIQSEIARSYLSPGPRFDSSCPHPMSPPPRTIVSVKHKREEHDY